MLRLCRGRTLKTSREGAPPDGRALSLFCEDDRVTPRAADLFRKFSVLVLVLVPLAGVVIAMRMLWERAVGWGDVALMIGLYVPVSMGITIGFHRYLTHRGFTAHPVVKVVPLVLGSMALEGPAVVWAATHRPRRRPAQRVGRLLPRAHRVAVRRPVGRST